MNEAVLEIWTVYRFPKDYPGKYVARLWRVGSGGGDGITDVGFVEDTLEAVRGRMIDRGLVCLARDETDDPVIVESWV
jgi:hypothetical protein